MGTINRTTLGGLVVTLILSAGLAACGGEGGASSSDHGPPVDETPAENLGSDQQQTASRQSLAHLNQVAAEWADGYTRVSGFNDRVAPIRVAAEDRWTVTLREGVVYRIVAACDDNCTDVDLFIDNAEGVVVDSDTLMDDYPVVDVTPASEGRYTIRTRMFGCAVEACYAATRIMSQQ